jgi:hypothetical protein
MRLCLSSVLALGAATFFATTAVAGDLPKERTFSVAGMASGNWKVVPEGSPWFVGLWDENGKITGEGLLKDMSWRCFGVPESIAIPFKTSGYCTGTDQDGERVLFRIATESPFLVFIIPTGLVFRLSEMESIRGSRLTIPSRVGSPAEANIRRIATAKAAISSRDCGKSTGRQRRG